MIELKRDFPFCVNKELHLIEVDYFQSNTDEKRESFGRSLKETTFTENDNSLSGDDISLTTLLKNLFPNLGSVLVSVFISSVEIHYIGKTGNNNLYDGVALGTLYVSSMFYYIGCGLSESLAMIGPKSFGSGNIKLLGLQTNQVRLFSSIFFVIVCVFSILFCDSILVLIAGNTPYVKIAKEYVFYTAPAYFMALHYEIYCKYSESQLIYKPMLVGMSVSMILHPFLCQILIVERELGVFGLSIALNITELIKLGIMLTYFCLRKSHSERTFCLDTKVFQNLGPMFKSSFLSALLYYSENLGFSVSSLFSANLGEVAYAIHITMSSICSLNSILSYGYLNTVSIIIGNYVGQNKPNMIKKTILYLSLLAASMQILFLVIIHMFQRNFFMFFSENKTVLSDPILSELLRIGIVYMVFDLVQNIFLGILRGLDLIRDVTTASIIIYFFVQPLMCLVSVRILGLGLRGVWIAITLSLMLLSLIYVIILLRTDVDEVCMEYEIQADEEKLCHRRC